MKDVVFDSKTRTFGADVDGFGALSFSVGAEIDGTPVGRLAWKPVRCSARVQVFAARNRLGTWQLSITNAKGSVAVAMECRLARKAERAVLTPVCFQDFPASQILIHGRRMGGCEGRLLRSKREETFGSEFFVSVTRGGHTLQVAHPLRQSDRSSLSGVTDNGTVKRLSAFTRFDPCERTRLRADPVFLSAAADGHRLLDDWAGAQVRQELNVPQESGWNSWDYYRWTITEDEVLKNAEFIASDPVLSRHVKRIIVDDGWQYCYGEWEANSLFPSGMEKLAKALRRMGFTPGLWFAPTIAEPHSRVAQLCPEMLTCGPAGVPCLAFSCMERKGFLLDPTHPKVVAWWNEIFQRYAKFGYGYFKLDFLSSTLPARRFHDASAGPGDLMRRIVAPIRAAVGPRARILGCNFSFDGGPGLADDVRTVSDIHASWAYVKRNAVAIGSRFWAHRRLWINDPDFAVCRGEETSQDPHLNQLKMLLPCVQPDRTSRELAPGLDAMDSLADLTAREAQTWLSLVIISGGVVNLSDNLPRLNKTGLQLLRKTVSAEKGGAGRPVDLFRSELPAQWIQKVTPSLHRILLINWRDRPALLRLDAKHLNLPGRTWTNFWTGEPIRSTRIEVELPPHGCLLAESRSSVQGVL